MIQRVMRRQCHVRGATGLRQWQPHRSDAVAGACNQRLLQHADRGQHRDRGVRADQTRNIACRVGVGSAPFWHQDAIEPAWQGGVAAILPGGKRRLRYQTERVGGARGILLPLGCHSDPDPDGRVARDHRITPSASSRE